MTDSVIFQCACAKLSYFYSRSQIWRSERSRWSTCVIVTNFVAIGQTVAEIWLFFDFSKMAAVCILDLRCACLDQSRRAFGGLYHCAKFGWNRGRSFDNMQVSIFCELGLKTPARPHFFLGGAKYGKAWCDVDLKGTRSYFWGLLPLCYFWRKSIKKCDRESADRRTDRRTDGHTHWQRQTEFIICPMLYSVAMRQIIQLIFYLLLQTLLHSDGACSHSHLAWFTDVDVNVYSRTDSNRYESRRTAHLYDERRSSTAGTYRVFYGRPETCLYSAQPYIS